MDKFPTSKELDYAVVEALQQLGGTATTQEINQKVIEILELPPEIVELEDENNFCTKLDYVLRLRRNHLKKKGIMTNPIKGTWKFIYVID